MVYKLDELRFKIIYLLKYLPAEFKTVSFLAEKLQVHENTIKNHLKVLKAKGFVEANKDHQNVNHYFVNEKYRDIHSCFECDVVVVPPPTQKVVST